MTAAVHPALAARAAAVRGALRHEDNPYFAALAGGRLGRAAFCRSQARFLPAVAYFSRPMLVLAARLDDPAARAVLLANAWEEHGAGEPARAHEATFRLLLARLGLEVREIAAAGGSGAEAGAFNAALMHACSAEPPAFALAALGIIERVFADISACLARTIVARGWLAPDDLVHYDLHAALDLDHAEGFWALVDWEREEATAAAGLTFGAEVFDRLWRDLHAAARGG